jgi:predicted XRE-type DNA-binding protein
MNDIVKADENIFVALGFNPAEAEILKLRADLMAKLELWIRDNQLTQEQAAEQLGIKQSRVFDLVRGKWQKFSLDMLLGLAIKAGIQFKVVFDEAA